MVKSQNMSQEVSTFSKELHTYGLVRSPSSAPRSIFKMFQEFPFSTSDKMIYQDLTSQNGLRVEGKMDNGGSTS